MNKKVISLLLSCTILFSFLPQSVEAATSNLQQIKTEMDDNLNKRNACHTLADAARVLEFTEDSELIRMAQQKWGEYNKIYLDNKKLYNEQLSKDKWAQKKKQYPAATQIWLYMKSLGWNDYVCAGILGNMMAEAGGQTLNIQWWVSGSYYGICQWSRGYYQVWGQDLNGQLNFLRETIPYEMNTYGFLYYNGFNYNKFLSLTNEKDAAMAFVKCYGRGGAGTYEIRKHNATVAYNYFTK